MNLRPIIHAILEDYALPWHGTTASAIGPEFSKTACDWQPPRGPWSKWSNCSPFSTIRDGSTNARITATVSVVLISPLNFVERCSTCPTPISSFCTKPVPITPMV